MATRIKFKIWLDRANIQELVVQLPESQGGTAVTDLSYITRIVFIVGGYQVDSSVAPTAIWWDDSETRTITINGADESFTGHIIKLQVGPEFSTAGLTAGEYEDCCLVIYDATHVEGASYADDIEVEAVNVCDVS